MENEQEKPKKRGRPRIYDVPDCENRAYKVKNIYIKNRCKNDEEFRKRVRAQNNIYKSIYYARKRAEKQAKKEAEKKAEN